MKLYNNTIELKFNPGSHRYTVNGKPVEGVTGVLGKVVAKDGLIQWAANMACGAFTDALSELIKSGVAIDESHLEQAATLAKKAHTAKKDKGADIGSITHDWINHYILGDKVEMPEEPQAKLAVEAFQKWHKETNPVFIETERVLYSLKYNFAGTCDAVAVIGGKRILLDFKTNDARHEWRSGRYTGNVTFYPEHFLQCGAYSLAYTEETKQPIDAHAILYVQKDGQHHWFVRDTVQEHEEGFVNALKLSRTLKELTRK